MRVKFIVSLLPYLMLAFVKIKENNMNKKLINEGVLFLIVLFGLLFENNLILMTIFIICSVLSTLYKIHTFKEEAKIKINVVLHIIYYMIPVVVFSILYKEHNMICYYIVLGMLIYIDSFYNIMLSKFNKKKSTSVENDKEIKVSKKNKEDNKSKSNTKNKRDNNKASKEKK